MLRESMGEPRENQLRQEFLQRTEVQSVVKELNKRTDLSDEVKSEVMSGIERDGELFDAVDAVKAS